jgi:hypothetical protein
MCTFRKKVFCHTKDEDLNGKWLQMWLETMQKDSWWPREETMSQS